MALARVLLRLETCPFLILDEASAALDAEADATIQRVIREEMKNATLLCIARERLFYCVISASLTYQRSPHDYWRL